MPITSLLIECRIEHVVGVEASVNLQEGAEVHQRREGYLVVVTDTPNCDSDRRLLENIKSIPGVITASPVFSCHEDSEPSFSETSSKTAAGSIAGVMEV